MGPIRSVPSPNHASPWGRKHFIREINYGGIYLYQQDIRRAILGSCFKVQCTIYRGLARRLAGEDKGCAKSVPDFPTVSKIQDAYKRVVTVGKCFVLSIRDGSWLPGVNLPGSQLYITVNVYTCPKGEATEPGPSAPPPASSLHTSLVQVCNRRPHCHFQRHIDKTGCE